MREKAAVLTLVLIACLGLAGLVLSGDESAAQDTRPERVVVRDVAYLGQATIAIGQLTDETEIGGLSAITYDPIIGRYYVLSDDRSERDPARFYTVSIDLSDGALTAGDVVFEDVTTLRDANGDPFPAGGIDPEGITLSGAGTLFIASEGALLNVPPVNPFVNEFGIDGQQIRELTVPAKFLPNGGASGVRNNLAFESLTLTPSEEYLYTAVENALQQDGPAADVGQSTLSRVIKFDQATGEAVQELVYVTEPAVAPVPADGLREHGLVELVALDNNGSFLALERGVAEGIGWTARLFLARAQGALDVSAVDDLVWDEQGMPYEIDPPITKDLLLDFADLGLPYFDNLEGMTLGPVLPDGRQTLILVSDNNFLPFQVTQFIALALTLETVPAALPSLETPVTHDDAAAPEGILAGDSDDPAIWLHPDDPVQSMVAFTLKDGGLVVMDLAGTVLHTVAAPVYGDIRYNNVDVVYNFPLGGESADIFIASDRQNDSLSVFRIDPATRQITDITSPSMPETIFGIDDGEQTAYGLGAYTSPVTGKVYAFVTQADGNLVAQVELTPDGTGLVGGTVVRTLELPVPTGDPADSQSEGIVVDRFLGQLYVGMENEVGILKFDAEPDGGTAYTVIHAVDEPYLLPDIEGLTIYYGAGDEGYLLASSQGDHTYAVFERRGDNAYLGSFIVADNGAIDQANESDGADVLNVPLGPAFPNGLLIVQDGANDPQNAVPDDAELENNSTNFKYVRWDSVANAFPEPLLIDTGSYNPRYPMRSLLPVISGN